MDTDCETLRIQSDAEIVSPRLKSSLTASGFGFSTTCKLSLPTHEKFNHEIHFDESFTTLAFSLHPQMGWKTSTAYQPEYVTPMAAVCHESQKSKQEKP